MTFPESWVDRVVREAAERGEFENLDGSGKPLEMLSDPYDENWWVKRWIEREKLSPRDLAKLKEHRDSH